MSSRGKTAECAAYFKGQPAWHRYFVQMRRKWEAYGRTGGRIVLSDATEDEREALVRVLGRKAKVPSEEEISEVSFSMREFEEALQHTRFAPISLKELLEAYFEEELQTRQEKKRLKEQGEEEFFEKLIENLIQKTGEKEEYQKGILWLRAMKEEHRYGYSVLMEARRVSQENAVSLVWNVEEVFADICAEDALAEIPLAVLAAKVTGNPHYFDRNSVGGKLFVNALCSLTTRECPATAYDWRELLLQYHILPDEMSNTVITFGVHLEVEDGLHPAFEGYCAMREPGILIMPALKKAKRAYGEGKAIFIVENEMVFSYLTEHLADKKVAVLCTSGQPCTVAIRLMELLCKENIPIYYSGDMDPEGIRIADRLWERFGGKIQPWRMGADDYRKGISEERISDRRLRILDMVKCTELQETVSCVREWRRTAYQENLLQELVQDLRLMV
ncbi:MAG: DUF2399 domain-containing protein [Lachnospiraceae bacterium]|nr:DUF2399 domain-containing protein [Lachnospiraceae bacterium]